MAAVTAPHGGRLRVVSAAGFVFGAAFFAAVIMLFGHPTPSAFIGYLVVLGGLMGALVFVSTAAALGLAPIRTKRASMFVVAGLASSIASVSVGYLLMANPPGNHLPLVALATVLGAGAWGEWHVHLGVLDRLGLALGLAMSVFVTFGLLSLTWGVGVVCKMLGV